MRLGLPNQEAEARMKLGVDHNRGEQGTDTEVAVASGEKSMERVPETTEFKHEQDPKQHARFAITEAFSHDGLSLRW